MRSASLTISSRGRSPPMPLMRSAALASAVAAPMPVEPGDTLISATVSGKIELPE